MRFFFILFIFILPNVHSSQIINSRLEEWETIDCCGQPFENPIGWQTNNDNNFFGLANTPVTKGENISGFHARIASHDQGIDALQPGIMSQTISTHHLQEIHFYAKCDSLFQTGRCIIQVLGDTQDDLLYTDSLATEDSIFQQRTIPILPNWIINHDSVTIRFVAKGNIDHFDLEEDGYSIFLVDNVIAEYASSISQNENDPIFHIYPNPVDDKLTMEFPTSLHDPVHIRIFNILGQSILNEAFQIPIHPIDVASLESGIYFYQITSGESLIQSGKLIKN